MASFGGTGDDSRLLLRARARYLVAAVFTSEEGFDPDEKGFDLKGDEDVIEEEVPGREFSTGWGVGRIVFARDVARVYRPITALR